MEGASNQIVMITHQFHEFCRGMNNILDGTSAVYLNLTLYYPFLLQSSEGLLPVMKIVQQDGLKQKKKLEN